MIKRVFKMLMILASMAIFAVETGTSIAKNKDLGNGFLQHGVATPSSNQRGTVATVDGKGSNVVLTWLMDHRGCYALLMIHVETGKAETIPIPSGPGDAPFSSILSSKNKFYTHFGAHFLEFDPTQGKFTACHKTKPRVAMGITEDDNGVIWAATFPNSGLISFNPKARELKDYGYLHQEDWRQYQRYVAADDTGWIYFGIGDTKSQIIAFDPMSGKARPVVPEHERGHGFGYVFRDLNGKVYGLPYSKAGDNWYELFRGEVKKIGKAPKMRKKTIISGSQSLFHQQFPDGKHFLRKCDLINRFIVVENRETKQVKKICFDYKSEGAQIMCVATVQGNTLCGGTAFPMRFFSYNPKTDKWMNRPAYGQWNTIVRQGDRIFVGAYAHGILLEWNPAKEWVNTIKGKPYCNPQYLIDNYPTIDRPRDILVHSDGKTVILAGTPGYGYTGGGLLFWDIEKYKHTRIDHRDILPWHSTMSLVALPAGKVLAGTTTTPGTGGEKKAKQAELYMMDIGRKRIEWHKVIFPGVQSYNDLCTGPKGRVLGFADYRRFFVFDPVRKKVIHEIETSTKFGETTSQQGPRIFVKSPDGKIYILFKKGIAEINPETFTITMLAESPVPISGGGDFLDGRIYYFSGSHLYSYGATTKAQVFSPKKPQIKN